MNSIFELHTHVLRSWNYIHFVLNTKTYAYCVRNIYGVHVYHGCDLWLRQTILTLRARRLRAFEWKDMI